MSTRIQTTIALTISVGLHGALALIPLVNAPPARAVRRVLPIQIVDAPVAEVKPPPPPVWLHKVRRKRRVVVHRKTSQLIDQPAVEPPSFGASPEQVMEGGEGPEVPQGDTLAAAPRPPEKPKTIKLKQPSFLRAPLAPPAARRDPRVKVEHKVPYPAEARDMGVEGTVKVQILVGADGRVHKAKVLSGPGFGLNRAARAALLKYLFYPALDEQGTARKMWITYKYTFLQD